MSCPVALQRVRADVLTCARCPRLVAHRRGVGTGGRADRPVPGFGDPLAGIHVLGMATAARGNPHGRPFTGNRSASFLTAGLHRAGLANSPTSESADDGLALYGVWTSSAVRCPPPSHRPTATERDTCATHLRAEWAALPRLRVVLALGALAWTAALAAAPDTGRVRFAHGREHLLLPGLVLLGSYHPSPQNTHTGVLTPTMLDTVLDRARSLGGGRARRAATTEPEEISP
ncbi:uracil-DNA glycosylase family protein [Pseudonocardia tropica]|uniref:Uracil-DNA glycosylase family 4 n=3 Tax=Pseudonocardia TaxID=1847 RepID=A0A4Q7V5D7_PSEST|nr:uracil-DNA glycosylase family protein [Pseudonocardia sediminis]RZT88781.1 uracil-DNA glycosylase family 4 [Pseudonocardia sediminis]